MTRPWHAPLRGLLAPLVALLAVPAALLFVCSCHVQSALPGLVWQLVTGLGVLVLCLTPRFRARPGVAAGLFGVVALAVGVPLLAALVPDAGAAWFFGGAAFCLGISAVASSIAEQPARMGETTLPSNHLRALALVLAVASSVSLVRLAAIEPPAPRVQAGGDVIGSVEIPALATTLRERLGARAGLDELELEATSEPQPGGGATARIWLSRPGSSRLAPARSGDGCVVDVPPLGRTVEIVAQEATLVVRWPVSPHGESFGVCTYDRATLAYYPDGVLATEAPPEVSWALGLGGPFVLLVLALSWSVRRRHARIARSPELHVTSPGLATMPDGTIAVLPADVPMGTSVVALRIADLRPDYRSDARVTVEELAEGEKNALLADLSRRTRTLELLALGGVCLFSSIALSLAITGAVLTP